MDKKIFDIIEEHCQLVNDLYFKLEKLGLDMDDIDELLEGFGDLYDKTLRTGKYSDDDKIIGKETYLNERYEDVKKYVKVNVIYEYDNGARLCQTTAGSLHLIPKEHLAEY